MASIIQIGKRWRALIRRKGHPPYCKTFGTQREAQAWARGVEASLDGSRPVSHDEMTVGALIEHYRRGALPFDRMIKTFPFDQINEAIAAQHHGDCIKVVLLTGA